MAPKLKTLLGIKKSEVDDLIRFGTIRVRQARLIPFINPGKEEALTSIFLSSLILVDEFRRDILGAIGLPKGSKIYVYTEVVFPDAPECRIDGLILVVSAGKIKTAALLEMKNGASTLEEKQITDYLNIAKSLNIPKLVTVSNEFVSEPTQSPLDLKKIPKGVELCHLSWQFIRTLARIRLFDNDTNIEDIDQVRIMEEVVAYFENDKSGVCGFSQMKPGWKNIVEKVGSRATLNKSDSDLRETVESWIQEEKDLALRLSCELGVLVQSGLKRFRGNIHARIDHEMESFLKRPTLTSSLKVSDAVSDLTIRADFERKAIEMSAEMLPPLDKTLKGQFGWIKRQIENKALSAKLKAEPETETILKQIWIELYFKHARKPVRVFYNDLQDHLDENKGKTLTKVSVVYVRGFGRSFGSVRKFIEEVENMLPRFYSEIVQFLSNWTKPAPKILEKASTPDE